MHYRSPKASQQSAVSENLTRGSTKSYQCKTRMRSIPTSRPYEYTQSPFYSFSLVSRPIWDSRSMNDSTMMLFRCSVSLVSDLEPYYRVCLTSNGQIDGLRFGSISISIPPNLLATQNQNQSNQSSGHLDIPSNILVTVLVTTRLHSPINRQRDLHYLNRLMHNHKQLPVVLSTTLV